ncbi:unnamed protein product [Mytilus coruscus]|uniref:Uncharacterized protein n=1 Tax=Mytilus coruscus TaxID=42192 RepID=A0A6J8EPA4_MYTCO|nr:unnamed protein product [Mytilus coruscus]
MDNSEQTDEHVVIDDIDPLSKQKQLTGKKLKEAKKKARKTRRADRKRNAGNANIYSNIIFKRADTLLQKYSSEESIENAILEDSQLPERFVVVGNYTEVLSKNNKGGAKKRESHKNQCIYSSNNSVEKSSQSCNEDENLGDVSSVTALEVSFGLEKHN